MEKGILCVPGWQLCRNCYHKQFHFLKENANDSDNEMDFSEIENEVAQSSIRSKINESFEAIGESPIKIHSMPKHRRLTYANKKLDKAAKLVQRHVATAIGVSENEISLPVGNISAEIEQKAQDLDHLMEEVKTQMAVSTFRMKIQLLTLTPKSWSINYAASFFHVSRYLVQKALKFKDEEGICSMPSAKQGKSLPVTVSNQVKRFYEDDQFSRLLPGKKDCFAKNMHTQKRLLLCNLKELYQLYKSKYPFQLITKEHMVVVHKDLQERFATGKTIPGTRSFHFFCPMNTRTISFKRTSEDEEFAGQFQGRI